MKPILDWGGEGMPDAPFQGVLFEQEDLGQARPTSHNTLRPDRRRARHQSRSAQPARMFDDLVAGRSFTAN